MASAQSNFFQGQNILIYYLRVEPKSVLEEQEDPNYIFFLESCQSNEVFASIFESLILFRHQIHHHLHFPVWVFTAFP